jgi:hypothetical protein
MNSWRFVLVSFALLGQIACASTQRQLKEQELRFLESRIANMEATKALLTAHPDPESESDFSAFVAGRELNELFALADYRTLPLPALKNTFIDLGTIRTSLGYGSADLEIVASARRKGLNVRLRFRAEIQPEVLTDQGKPVLSLRIFVHEIVPDVSWWFGNIRLHRFLQDLARVEANRYLEELGDFRFPLESVTTLALAGDQQQKDIHIPGGGKIYGVITTPSVQADVSFRVDRILLLRDGLHVFFSFE